MTKVKTSAFVTKVLAGFNKTDAQKQQENVERFLGDATIDCEEQISTRDADIKRAEVAITRANTEVSRAEAGVETALYSVANNFADYLNFLNVARQRLHNAKQVLDAAERQKALLVAEREQLEEVLAVLQS
jgi:hypothetical protein